jgi:PhnB protein
MSPNRVRPKLVVSDAAAALDFYAQVLDAQEIARYDVEGAIVFAETEVFGTRITLKDADQHDRVPEGAGPLLDVLVPDPDRVADAILEGGGSVIFEMSDQPFGGRWGRVRDPFGVQWLLHTDPTMSPDEIRAVLSDDPASP